ncbi:MAG TPA: hypothetical protein VK116_11730, partial [Planctomycetota bacterium]|nr:hypothetical protein [Planctomycetota bacterium]
LSRTGGVRGIGEGLARMGDITSESQILLGYHPDRDPTMNDDRAREERMRGRLGELEAKREQDALPENDPSSDLSQFIRGELGKLGFDFPESVSAAQVKQYFPGVYEPFRDRYEDMLGAMKGEAQADAETTKAIAQERTRFLGNRTLSEAIDALQQADTVEALIDTEPLGVAASIVKMARLAGEKGQLSNRDVESWRRRLGFQGTWDKFVEYVTSEPSEGYKQQLLAVAKEMREKLRQSVRGQAKREAKTFLKVHAGKVPYSEKDVDRFIDDVYLGGDFQSKVRLRHRQTGEVREFDPAMAQQIMAQGLADPIDEPGINPHYTRRELGEG